MIAKDGLHHLISIYSFSEINSHIKEMDSKTLILVDVDSTLIIPQNPLLHPTAFTKYKDIVRELYQSITLEEKHLVNHLIAAEKAMIVEDLCVDWINKIQAQCIPILAITAAKKGRFGNSNIEFHQIRFEQLKKLGIDFSIHCYPDTEFRALASTHGDYPSLIDGIIYASGFNNTKGDIVCELLKIYSNFERIVMIDDKKKHLDSVSKTLLELDVKAQFFGFHYQGADLLQPEVAVSEKDFQEYLNSLIQVVKQ